MLQNVNHGSISFLTKYICTFIVWYRGQGCCCHLFLLSHISMQCICMLRLLKACSLFSSLNSRNAKHAKVDYGRHDARRKHNSVHEKDLWTAAQVCTGLLCFPISPCISFLYLILEWISWRWNCALNMFQAHLNFNESPALLFGNSGPSWIVAITDSFGLY